MSEFSNEIDSRLARIAARQRQAQRDQRPTLIEVDGTAVVVSHADFNDAQVYDGKGIRLKLIRAGQSRPYADTTWEAQLEFYDGAALWYPALAQIEQAAISLAAALLRSSAPMSVEMLRREAPASWRVIVTKPYNGWD